MSEAPSIRASKKEVQEANRRNRRLAIGGLITATGVAAGGIYLATREHQQLTLKENILNFSWADYENEEKIGDLTQKLAENYLKLTRTDRLNPKNLTSPNQTLTFRNSQQFIEAIRKVEPTFTTTLDQWGYAHFASEKIFIDLNALKDQAKPQTPIAGLALADAFWHEWSHLDIKERDQGQFINNPQATFPSPNSGKEEVFRKYRGGEIFTDTYFGFLRFEEVWNETLIIRRLVEQVGLEVLVAAGNYYQNGIDFFPKLTSTLGISLNILYQLHATSDLEGLAKLIGQKLPGNSDPIVKGMALFNAIHQSNQSLIEQSGALTLIR